MENEQTQIEQTQLQPKKSSCLKSIFLWGCLPLVVICLLMGACTAFFWNKLKENPDFKRLSAQFEEIVEGVQNATQYDANLSNTNAQFTKVSEADGVTEYTWSATIKNNNDKELKVIVIGTLKNAQGEDLTSVEKNASGITIAADSGMIVTDVVVPAHGEQPVTSTAKIETAKFNEAKSIQVQQTSFSPDLLKLQR